MLEVGKVYIYKKKYPVYITDGQYMGDYGRVSNFWYWRKIEKDGSLSKKEYHDYDNNDYFIPFKGKVKVKILLSIPDTIKNMEMYVENMRKSLIFKNKFGRMKKNT